MADLTRLDAELQRAGDLSRWLERYEWYAELPRPWKQVTNRLAKEIGANRFVGMTALHQALSAKSEVAMWDALANVELSDKCIELIDEVLI